MRSIWRVAARDLVRVGVERQVADAQRGHAARRPAAQQRAQAGEQLLALERLDEVVVGADVEPLHARLQRVARGEHQDRRVVAVVAQALGDVDAVQARQPEVEHDDVGQEGVRLVERRDAVGGELDLVALEAQRALQNLRDLLVVLDDEHADGAAGGFHRTHDGTACGIWPESSDDALSEPRAGVARASKGAGQMPAAQEAKPAQAGARAAPVAPGPVCPRSSSASST